MNIAEYCIKKPTVTVSFAVAMLVAATAATRTVPNCILIFMILPFSDLYLR